MNDTDSGADGDAARSDAAPAGAQTGAADAGGSPLSGVDLAMTDLDRRIMLVVTHVLAAMVVLAMWGAADAWQKVTGLRLAGLLSVTTAFVAGAVLGTLVHEWGHFLGARIAGASYTIPGKPGLFLFNFDFARNSTAQFLTMSWGGQAGGILAVLLLWWAVPLDTAGRAMLVAAAAGAAVFAAAIEWPVIRRTREGGNPAQELGRIDRGVLQASATKGLVATAVSWFLLS